MKPYVAIWIFLFFSIDITRAEDIAESLPESIYQARVSIIIDDLGYSLKQGHLLAAFPFDLTISIIPFTPYSTDIARLIYRSDKEVMLHAPMETLNQKKWEQGLSSEMTERELTGTIDKMLHNIPHVKGVNNHGGSKLTQDRSRMNWVMSHLAQKRLYFIDSRTIASSAAIDAASSAEVAHNSRDIFLDNNKSHQHIREQIQKLRTVALNKGKAIGIGHPYPETMTILMEELPKFVADGIQIVSASKIVEKNDKLTVTDQYTRHLIVLE